ncbi:hypothetical protein [Catellatospora sichuanensis]|nr:hypothetical protein [Catellatospora sichuanensis]
MDGTLIREATPGGLSTMLSLPEAGPGEDACAAVAGEETGA